LAGFQYDLSADDIACSSVLTNLGRKVLCELGLTEFFLGNPRILVVEDDGATRRALTRLFKGMGLIPAEASTLREALESAADVFDIVCLDLLLPDGNGVEVLRHIRERRIASKVVVVSAANEPNVLAQVTRLHADAIFGKPLDVDDFRDWLRSKGLLISATQTG
jgi:CheY-like chemotaxis protein